MITVGKLLKSQRKRKKLTLDDVTDATKVHRKYLKALESDDCSIFSNKIHATGFLKLYAEYLELDVNQVLAFWRREFEGDFDKKAINNSKKISFAGIENSKLLITPGVIFAVLISVVIVGFFGYLFVQYNQYSGAPSLYIYNPSDNQVVSEDLLDVLGKTERDSVLFINNQRVVLNTDGSFATSLKLSEGLNTLSFSAVNKLGKETEQVKTIIYRPKEVPAEIEFISGAVNDQEVAGASILSDTSAESTLNLVVENTSPSSEIN